MVGLSKRERIQLNKCLKSPGLWSGVPPHNSDPELHRWFSHGLVRWLGDGKGYEVTDKGRSAISRSKTN